MNWRKLHKWIGLIVGIQLLLWIAGGVYMSAMPLDWVHGKHLIKPSTSDVTPSNDVLTQIDLSQYQSIRWVNRVGFPILEAINLENEFEFIDPAAYELKPLLKLTEADVSTEAIYRYTGSNPIASVNYLATPPHEASGISMPIYQVQFSDWCNTTFYMHPFTGQVLKVRSDIWRLFDIFWMLHIMDYETRENINNPLLIATAVIALLFCVTGMLLIFTWVNRWYRRRNVYA